MPVFQLVHIGCGLKPVACCLPVISWFCCSRFVVTRRELSVLCFFFFFASELHVEFTCLKKYIFVVIQSVRGHFLFPVILPVVVVGIRRGRWVDRCIDCVR